MPMILLNFLQVTIAGKEAMEYSETSNIQKIDEGDEINTLMMIQQKEEMFGQREISIGNFDNAEIMNILAASDAENNHNNTKKKYQRHTAHQIQQLEAVFRECPHPDERLRIELSQRLGLDLKQIKFWFQNKRTQIKAQTEHNINILLKEENDRLRQENEALKAALTYPMCRNCRHLQPPFSLKGKTPIVENAHLKECYSTSLSASANMSQPSPNILLPSVSKYVPTPVGTMVHNASRGSSLVELANKAMRQLLRMTEQSNTSLWIKNGDCEVLNIEEYERTFPSVLSATASNFAHNFAHEASRDTDVVISPSQALVDIFMDPERWMKMFPSMISAASTIQFISPGMGRTKNGIIQLMEAELQVLSPMVPLCKLKFLRYCKQFGVRKWVVVDVSADIHSGMQTESPYLPFRQLPSGCIIQEIPNGRSNITWLAHYEYDESAVAPLCRSMLRAGFGFGSTVWLERLKRQCECISLFAQSARAPEGLQQSANFIDKRGLLYLAQRMSDSFCHGVSSSRFQWTNIQNGATGNNYVFIKSRTSFDQPGEPSGIVLSATTSFWLPANRDNLFGYLRDVNERNQWDILSQDEGFLTLLNVNKGLQNYSNHDNAISIFRANNVTSDNIVILQDTWSDDSASLIVYATPEISDIQRVLEGGDSTSIFILPSGFAIYTDSQTIQTSGLTSNLNFDDQSHLPIIGDIIETDGSLLTVGFQVFVNTSPLKMVEEENIRILNSLVAKTCDKIREAMGCA